MTHGYVSYTQGCRCDACRKAKADYMSQRRALARSQPADAMTPFKHGTRYGYEERGCRCSLCRGARARSDLIYSKRRREA